MSQHPSLRSSEKMRQHRSVLKRYERLRLLKEKGLWDKEGSVFGLPKVKMVRFKIKKEKAAAETPEGEAAATPAAAPSAGQAPKGAGPKAQAAEAKKPESKEAAKPKK